MSNADSKQLYQFYRPSGVALLRATAEAINDAPDRWPDPSNAKDCRTWLDDMWPRSRSTAAIRQASPGLAGRVDAICSDAPVSDKQIRQATLSVVRYLLRSTGRHMPFGLFAGVASASLGRAAFVRWGDDHRSFVRVDTQWLGDIVGRLEAAPDLLDRLNVVFNNLAVERGDDLEAPSGASRVKVRRTKAVQAVREAAATPIRFGVLVDELAEVSWGVSDVKVRGMLTELVRQGLLITNLRAPATVSDPLTYVVHQLRDADAGMLTSVAPVLAELELIRAEAHHHNRTDLGQTEQASIRASLTARMQAMSPAGRTPLAVDLRLDCDLNLPDHVAEEMGRAASALMRLTRQPTGEAAWREFYIAFCERYGINALVPLADVVNPDAGIGLPATYPGSTMSILLSGPSERDEKLLGLAWQAMADGSDEILLTDELIGSLAVGDPSIERSIPPHVELAAQIWATSTEALQNGDYTLVVHPAQSAGTFTSRLAYLVPDAGLQDVYRGVPVATEGALPVQLSFPPIYPHAENICRVPAYLPHVLALGEHRSDNDGVVPVDDLAVTATRDGLHLISISRQRVLEPQIFHALALDKQPPPLARLLAHLSRGLGAAWHRFDWGPAARQLSYLPRVRYRRSILSPATWRLTVDDLASAADEHRWKEAVDNWRQRWRCPATVELQDADRSLPLTLTEPAHIAIVRAQLERHGVAVFTETAGASDLGWIGGHAHDIALPLVTTRSPAKSPTARTSPLVTNHTHGQVAAATGVHWLYAKIYTHPERMNDLISVELPRLLSSLGSGQGYWFARYRSAHETDHLRLRLRVHDVDHYKDAVAAVGRWAEQLQRTGKTGRLVIDTYYPEIGRYGQGPTMAAAEEVFVADSQLVAAQLRHLPGHILDPAVLAAVNMVGTIEGFLGSMETASRWLKSHPAPAVVADRAATDEVTTLVRTGMLGSLPEWNEEMATAWQRRTAALAGYRQQLTDTARTDDVLESLLHMHHNRAIGIDREGEAICRRLARQAAVAWAAQPLSRAQ